MSSNKSKKIVLMAIIMIIMLSTILFGIIRKGKNKDVQTYENFLSKEIDSTQVTNSLTKNTVLLSQVTEIQGKEKEETKKIFSDWKQENEKWYYYDEYGMIKTGWFQVNHIWYYGQENGAIYQNGIYEIDNKRYQFDETGAYVEEYDRFQSYIHIIEKYEQQYGIATLHSIDNGNSGAYLSGVCFLKLLDFDRDGEKELMLVYEVDDNSYCSEIFDYINGTCAMLYSTKEVYTTSGSPYKTSIVLANYEEKIYLITNTKNQGNVVEAYYTWKDGGFEKISEEESKRINKQGLENNKEYYELTSSFPFGMAISVNSSLIELIQTKEELGMKLDQQYVEEIKNMEVIHIADQMFFSNIEELDLSYQNISDISELSKCKSLKKLDLGFENDDYFYNLYREEVINDISMLKGCSKLEELYLDGTEVKDINVVQYLPKLKVLSIYNTKIENFEALQFCDNLEVLYLSDITNLDVLQSCKKLKELHISLSSKGNDISALKNCTNLEVLRLDCNGITDIGVLKNLQNLKTLILWNVEQVNNYNVFMYLPNLEKLNIGQSYKRIELENIEFLSNCTKLKEVYLCNCYKLKDIGILKNCKELMYLWLGETAVTDFSPVSHVATVVYYD